MEMNGGNTMTKILFSDLDGTIIGEKNVPLHKNNLPALQKLRDAGHKVALCTGRNNIDLLPTLKVTPIPYDYLVLCNGGYIVDESGKVLYESDVPMDVAKDLLLEFIKQEQLVTYFCDTKRCVLKSPEGVRVIDDNGDVSDYQDDKVFMDYFEKAKRFTIIGINQADLKTDFLEGYAKKMLDPYDDCLSWFYNRAYIDIMGSGASKGDGMLHLASILGFEKEDVYAIGDSFNDLSMIEKAGHGYTFHRSPEVVKEKADGLVDYLYELVDKMLLDE